MSLYEFLFIYSIFLESNILEPKNFLTPTTPTTSTTCPSSYLAAFFVFSFFFHVNIDFFLCFSFHLFSFSSANFFFRKFYCS